MTDYLTALATRALAPREVLQPRLPRRFEPAVEEVVATGESVASRQETLETQSLSMRASEKPSPSNASKVPPLPSAPERRRDAATPAGETPALRRTALPLPAPVVPAPPVSEPPRPDSPPAVAIERKAIAEEIENTTLGNTAVESPPAVARASEPRRPQPVVRTSRRDRVAPPRVIERLRVRREESIAAPAPPAPVEITIGRIDVRAVVAAQPPAAKPKAQPRVMSLDEYAAKRDGRNR